MAAKNAREAKLPRWARVELERLRADLVAVREKLHGMTHEGGSDTVLVDYGDEVREVALPPGSHIRFKLTDGRGRPEWIGVYVRRFDHGEPPVVDVNSSRTLRIGPRASNAVWLAVEAWR